MKRDKRQYEKADQEETAHYMRVELPHNPKNWWQLKGREGKGQQIFAMLDKVGWQSELGDWLSKYPTTWESVFFI